MMYFNNNTKNKNNDYAENCENLKYKRNRSLQNSLIYAETSHSNSIGISKWNDCSPSQSIDNKPLCAVTVYDGTILSPLNTASPQCSCINYLGEASTEIIDSGISSPTSLLVDNLECVKDKPQGSSKTYIAYDTIEVLADNDCHTKNTNPKCQLQLPRLSSCYQSPGGIGGIVSRIRSMSIGVSPSSNYASRRPSGEGYSLPYDSHICTSPNQDLDPLKLPKDHTNGSLNFTNKTIVPNRKYARMSHSLSCDVDSFKLNELPSTMNRLERFLSGHIDTSTPNGALLSVINQGLRKVSESDRYFLFSKSPLRSPVDFLDSGIEHLEDSDILITVLHHSTCYDLMPENGKLIILDSTLSINKAFIAIEDNKVDSAAIWNNQDRSFIGMLGRNNQMHLLLLAYQYKEKGVDSDSYMNRISRESLFNCIDGDPTRYKLQYVNPENTICSVIKRLDITSSTQVLVIDERLSGNALYILDHRRILTFLLSASQYGLPLPSVLKNTVGVTELMMNRKILENYKVYPNTNLATLLQVMDSNQHHCAIVCRKKMACHICLCTDECIDLLTVDDISILISKSRHCDPTYKVESILGVVSHCDKKRLVYCQEREPVINVIRSIIQEKTPLILINQNCCRNCIHSIVSSKELLNYIVKHDKFSVSKENSYITEKRKSPRSYSCCEEIQKIADMNLPRHGVSLDEKEEDVFNMEVS